MRVTDIFDEFLLGKLSGQALQDFTSRLEKEPAFARAFKEHKQLVSDLQENAKRQDLRRQLQSIHAKEIGNGRVIPMHKEENFAQKHARTLVVAASTALIAVLSTVALLSTGGYLLKKQNSQITDLGRQVMELKASSEGIIDGIRKTNNNKKYAPANFEGSAFALNNKGYIVTSFHMVNGADSIFVQNAQTERCLTKLVFCDPKLDLAVLRLVNDATYKNWKVPFTIKEKSADIGEKVFTLGYPRKDVVYGEGALSSLSGYSNDTSMYQVSIPVNPGNSGGPLLDESGNVIGVIRGKISSAEGTSFAIKAEQILRSIETMAAEEQKNDLLTGSARKSPLRNLRRAEQIRKINPYVFNVLIYKGE